MKSVEIICCFFIVIFTLAVAHPLPDNVLEQVDAKEGGGILAQDSIQTQVLPSAKLDPTASSLLLMDPSGPALLFKDPTASALALEEAPKPALLLKDPTEAALALKDPTAASYLQKLPAVDFVALDMSQEDLQEQQDPEPIMFSEEALEAMYNDTPEESELQKE